jgi:hypothetical protein
VPHRTATTNLIAERAGQPPNSARRNPKQGTARSPVPALAAKLISYLRAKGITLTYDPDGRQNTPVTAGYGVLLCPRDLNTQGCHVAQLWPPHAAADHGPLQPRARGTTIVVALGGRRRVRGKD